MRVISASCPDTNATLLEAFRQHLADRDLAPSTVQAYLSDLLRLRLAPAPDLWHAARDTPADVTRSSHGGAG